MNVDMMPVFEKTRAATGVKFDDSCDVPSSASSDRCVHKCRGNATVARDMKYGHTCARKVVNKKPFSLQTDRHMAE